MVYDAISLRAWLQVSEFGDDLNFLVGQVIQLAPGSWHRLWANVFYGGVTCLIERRLLAHAGGQDVVFILEGFFQKSLGGVVDKWRQKLKGDKEVLRTELGMRNSLSHSKLHHKLQLHILATSQRWINIPRLTSDFRSLIMSNQDYNISRHVIQADTSCLERYVTTNTCNKIHI